MRLFKNLMSLVFVFAVGGACAHKGCGCGKKTDGKEATASCKCGADCGCKS